jgi:hypothetical protein
MEGSNLLNVASESLLEIGTGKEKIFGAWTITLLIDVIVALL